MRVLTWNIQATRGCDGQYDLPRIVSHIRQYEQLDVICLQEVSRYIPDLNNDDQMVLIAKQFPEYKPIWAPGFSVPRSGNDAFLQNAQKRDDQRVQQKSTSERSHRTPKQAQQASEFGNLTLVKRTILRNSRIHTLPSPPVQDLQLCRTMVETVVVYGNCQLTIFNAHLAFHSNMERIEQIKALNLLKDQIIAKSDSEHAHKGIGPYQYADNSTAVILCGDLNVSSDTDEFNKHITDQSWLDCWRLQYHNEKPPSEVRQPTCGCFDHVQWPEGAHVRDYFLTTDSLSNNIVSVTVDTETDASDHQPVLLVLCS